MLLGIDFSAFSPQSGPRCPLLYSLSAYSISSNSAKLVPLGGVNANLDNTRLLLKCQNTVTALQCNVRDMIIFLWFIDVGKGVLYNTDLLSAELEEKPPNKLLSPISSLLK